MRDILLAALKVAAATLANLLGWMLAVKIISVQLGAAGVGLFGILRQLLQYLVVVATFAGHTALIQGIASRVDEAQRRFAESVQTLMVLMAAGVALVLILGAPVIAPSLIPHPQAILLLRWLALAALCMAAQTLYTSVLTAYRLLDQLVISQLVGPVCALLLVLPMVVLVRAGASSGFVLMLGLPPAAVALAAFWATRKAGRLPAFRTAIDGKDAAYFFRMSSVLLMTGLLNTGAQYFMNRIVAARIGLSMAGYYWVAWTLSMAYVTLALGSFGNYYMPSLSRLQDPEDRRALMRSYLQMAVVAMPVLVSLAILFKPLVVRVMFSASLLPALSVMRWMLIGDFFKGVSWVLSFPMLAFHELRWFFWTEVAFTLGLAGSGWAVLAAGGGVEWLGIMFLALYLCYTAVMVYYAYVSHGFVIRSGEAYRIALGAGLILVLSAMTWQHRELHGWTVLLGLGLIGLFLAFSLRKVASFRDLFSKSPKLAEAPVPRPTPPSESTE
ncbi:MAG: oligosaccharide flippase family protein [Geothrix sp.]|uniref:oligosaccharide flippase family protein n=1 Tax=Geothrix sp. TaxID=1962974 RepID=UPI0017D152E6|nr:oligosaccharide flippase family protein [Geothrix sp.]NWJ42552.1 oligosaccharide flippase family protein [Geothrix sp.]WIL19487.1 MAG: oligosaccharide flippase family protein [Geothrix sp.]